MSTHLRLALLLLLLLPVVAPACASNGDETTVVAPDNPLALEPEPGVFGESEVLDQKVRDPNRVVARVNDQIITVRSIEAEIGPALDALPPGEEDQAGMLIERYALRMIVNRLQLEAAGKLGIEVSKEEMARVFEMAEEEAKERGTTLDDDLAARGVPRWQWDEEQRRKLLAEKYIRMTMGQLQPVSPETRAIADAYVRPSEVRSYFDRHPEEFRQEKSAKVSAVFIYFMDFDPAANPGRTAQQWAEGRAREIINRSRGGENWAAIVTELHGDRPPRGFEEPFKPGERNGDFAEEFAWSSRRGDISEPIARKSGLLLLKLLEKTEDRVLSYEEVKDDLENQIRVLKLQAAQLKIQAGLLRDSVVEPRRYKNQLRELFQSETAKVLNQLSR